MENKILQYLFHCFISLFLLISLTNTVSGTNYYVATTGSNSISNLGTSVGSPFLTLAYAVTKVVAGDSIYMRGGTYVTTATISISKSGTITSKYYLFVYPGDDRPILDFSSMGYGSRGINLSGSYWYLKGIKIKGAGDNGLNISGAYNTIEFCDFYQNRDGGCQLGGGAHDNRIINCDSYHNADWGPGSTTSGGNADGFSPKLDVGTNNYFYGCRSYYNSDDGWDGYLRPSDNVTTTLENCWTWHNGYVQLATHDTTTSSMNGNGFKLGGSDGTVHTLRHNFIVKNCLAFNNKAKGFDQNNNVGSITIYNGTSFNNIGKNFNLNSSVTLIAGSVFTVTNCVSIGSSGTTFRASTVLNTNQFGATAADFISVDTSGVSAPRKADGSLPDITFMHLSPSSALINAGTDVGLPFNGTKPDLGCFETGNSSTQYTLTTGVASGSGTVAPSGATKLYSGNTISIAATPTPGYLFDKWTNGSGTTLSTSNPYTVTMNSDLTVNANFKSIPQFTLFTSIASGSGTITPANGTKFYADSTATLAATPSANYTFGSWGGDASGTTTTTTVKMTSDKSTTASFTPVKKTLTIAINPVNSGTAMPASGTTYDYRSRVKLMATPATGYVFDKWTDNLATSLGTYDTLTITMDADKTITGNFKLNTGVNNINTPDNSFNLWREASGDLSIVFTLEASAPVSINLFNTQGALVYAVPVKNYIAGNHQINLTVKSITPGIYLCKLVVNGKSETRKLMVEE